MQNGVTPLFIAAQEGHLETCRELIERGASIDQPLNVRATLISSKYMRDSSVVRALARKARGPGFDPQLRCLSFSFLRPSVSAFFL